MRRRIVTIILASVTLAACSGGHTGFDTDTGTTTDATSDAAANCHSNSDCDDHTACTTDLCLVGGVCQNSPNNNMCPAGQTCVSGHGCGTQTMMCTTQAQCNDSIACTMDACLVDGTCQHTAVNTQCPAGQTCDIHMGCMAGCTSAADCNDTFDCTVDTCDSTGHCIHTAQNNRCPTNQTCNPTMGCVVVSSCQSDPQCDDHMYCNGVEHCNTELACVSGTPVDCTSSDPCMVGMCNETMHACTYMANPACMAGRSGTYGAAPPVDYTCSDTTFGTGVAAEVVVSFFQVSNTASGLTITCGNTMSRGAPPPMMGAAPAADGSFSVMGVRTGGCRETYRLVGQFTSPTMFTGTLSVAFAGADCQFTDCAAQSWPVMGTLM